MVERARKGDANDCLYQLEASMDYDPSADLEKIKAPVRAINFEVDELNPPELGILEKAISRLKNGRLLIIPAGPQSRGHYTALQAVEIPLRRIHESGSAVAAISLSRNDRIR